MVYLNLCHGMSRCPACMMQAAISPLSQGKLRLLIVSPPCKHGGCLSDIPINVLLLWRQLGYGTTVLRAWCKVSVLTGGPFKAPIQLLPSQA